MVKIAVLGYGTVGSGVVEVIRKNYAGIKEKAGKGIVVKKILDIRDFEGHPDKDLITRDADEIFNDDSIKIVTETIGGTKIAYELTKRALSSGRSVVTSNKELVALKGPELMQIARENNVNYLFEASVGGGIPIIRPLTQCLAANEVYEITGILNGTTNYILSNMKKRGYTFDEALDEARNRGYTEADPSADIDGHDACRKIAILASIAFNQYVDPAYIYTEGISSVTKEDLIYAEAAGCVIKLIATAGYDPDKSDASKGRVLVSARVSPVMFTGEHPLANVDDVFNAILVRGNITGEIMFYGRGAGKLPTASAVIADIIDIVRHDGKVISNKWDIKPYRNVIDREETETRLYIRLEGGTAAEDGADGNVTDNADDNIMEAIKRIFGEVTYINVKKNKVKSKIAFITSRDREGILYAKAVKLGDLLKTYHVGSIIRYGL